MSREATLKRCRRCQAADRDANWECRTCESMCCEHPETARDTCHAILVMLAKAPSFQLNQTTMARKLGCRAASLNQVLGLLRRRGLIERAYRNPNLEKPSATTYRLTAAGITGVQALHAFDGAS